MRLLVVGVTRTGNLGGTAMLCALDDVLADKLDDFALASILPRRDSLQKGPDRARIVDADYRIWLLLIAPLCILLWPLRRMRWVRAMTGRLPILRDFARADAIADLSGITFVDGRGLPLLYYNVAVALPGLFLDVPVHKLSQALGPFERPFNRRLAGWVLRRCRSVAARGRRSLANLHQLGIASATYRPDTSFAMLIPDEARAAARRQIEKTGLRRSGAPLVIIAPSAVVEGYCRRKGLDLVTILADTIVALEKSGMRVGLLAHASDSGIAKNDDVKVVESVLDRLGRHDTTAARLDPFGDPRLARAIIAEADVFVASRFHTLIGALSQAVPVATIGWSHKYAEAADEFAMSDYTIDYSALHVTGLVALVTRLAAERDGYRRLMQPVAKRMSDEARAGIEIVLQGALS